MSSEIGLIICATIAMIQIYKSITREKKKNSAEGALSAKTNSDCIKYLISRSLTDSNIEQ